MTSLSSIIKKGAYLLVSTNLFLGLGCATRNLMNLKLNEADKDYNQNDNFCAKLYYKIIEKEARVYFGLIDFRCDDCYDGYILFDKDKNPSKIIELNPCKKDFSDEDIERMLERHKGIETKGF